MIMKDAILILELQEEKKRTISDYSEIYAEKKYRGQILKVGLTIFKV